jgi:hypothetical protein
VELTLQRVKLDVVAFGPSAGGSDVTALATGTGGKVVTANAGALRGAFENLAGAVAPPVLVVAEVPT